MAAQVMNPVSQNYKFINGRWECRTKFDAIPDGGNDIFYVANNIVNIIGYIMPNGGAAPTCTIDHTTADDATKNGQAKITRTVAAGSASEPWTVITDHGTAGLSSYAEDGRSTTGTAA